MSQHHTSLNARRWEAARKACFKRDKYRCRQCHRPGRLEAHHIQPLEEGGAAYDLDNLETLCRDCHIARHRISKLSSSPAEKAWRALVEELSPIS